MVVATILAPGRIADTYDKVHLVPFGEYLPGPLDAALRALGLRQFIAVPGGFTAGSAAGQRILDIPGLPPAAATICYEAIFPGAIVPRAQDGAAPREPGLILNVTNDACFGDTPGPRQHLAQVVLIGTGSEVHLAVEAQKALADKGINARVVSMPCVEWFDEQPQGYRDSVLPPCESTRGHRIR